eukprot:scaffold28204_cov65-Phaeocystis_antarctica.AAC.5
MTVDWMRPWLFKQANSTMPSRLPRSVRAPLSLSSLSALSLCSSLADLCSRAVAGSAGRGLVRARSLRVRRHNTASARYTY